MNRDQDRNDSNQVSIRLKIEQVCDVFQQAWVAGDQPDIGKFLDGSFLQSLQLPQNAEFRQRLACELVKIQLAQQAIAPNDRNVAKRSEANTKDTPEAVEEKAPEASTPSLSLDEFATVIPELGPVAQLPADLIVEEYRARRNAGEKPNHDAYKTRFPDQWQTVLPQLIKAGRNGRIHCEWRSRIRSRNAQLR